MNVRKLGETDEYIENILRCHLRYQLSQNKDGSSFVRGGKVGITMDIPTAKKEINDDISNLLVHFRMASTGSPCLQNCHWWSKQGWNFMHNGIVNNFSYQTQGDTDDSTDSEQFFDSLLEEIGKTPAIKDVIEVIDEQVDRKWFSGRAILYHAKSDRAFIFGDWQLYLINSNYLVISSKPLSLDVLGQTETQAGFKFVREDPTNLDIKSLEIDGIGIINKFFTPDLDYKFIKNLKPRYPVNHSVSQSTHERLY